MERSNWRRRSRAELLWERAEGKREMAHFPRCQLNRVEWLAVNKKTPTIYSATFVPSVISRLWFLVFTEPLWFCAAVLLFPAETPYSVTRSLLCTSFFPFFLSTVDIKSITQVWVCFTLEHYWVSVLVRYTLPWFSSEFQSYFKAHKPTVTFSYSCSQTFFATLPSRNKKSSYSRAPPFLIPIIKKKKKKNASWILVKQRSAKEYQQTLVLFSYEFIQFCFTPYFFSWLFIPPLQWLYARPLVWELLS